MTLSKKEKEAIISSVAWASGLVSAIHNLRLMLEENADMPHADEEEHIQKQYLKLRDCLRETEYIMIFPQPKPVSYYQDSTDDTGRADSKI